jgi:ribulose 1,5-bisphosphate carboxylase large subunit-like protein
MAEHASTDAALTVLVAPGRELTVAASASRIAGTESVFARIEVDTMRPSASERHAARFALIGPRSSVLDVLAQLAAAVDAAQVTDETA